MLPALGFLLRIFSYLFHLVLALFLLGMSIVAMLSGKVLLLPMLPWEGQPLNYWTFGLGIAGILCVFLAITNIFRFLFPIWALAVFFLMLYGFYSMSYYTGGSSEFQMALWLTFGAFVAIWGSFSILVRRRPRR